MPNPNSETSFEDDFAALVGEQPQDPSLSDADPADNADPEPKDPPAEDPPADDPKGDPKDEPPGDPAEDTKAEEKADTDKQLSYDALLDMVPEERRKDAEAIVERAKKAEHRVASDVGRQAALQRRYHEAVQRTESLQAELKAAQERLASATTAEERREAKAEVANAETALQEDDDLLGKEYPELKKPVELAVQRILSQQGIKPAERPATDEQRKDGAPAPQTEPQSNVADHTADADIEKAYTSLSELVPDWVQAVTDPNWEAWVSQQPPGVQKLGDSDDPQDAAWLIGQFKQYRGEVERRVRGQQSQENREQLKQHVAPRRNANPNTNTGGASFEDQFAAFARESESGRR